MIHIQEMTLFFVNLIKKKIIG